VNHILTYFQKATPTHASYVGLILRIVYTSSMIKSRIIRFYEFTKLMDKVQNSNIALLNYMHINKLGRGHRLCACITSRKLKSETGQEQVEPV